LAHALGRSREWIVAHPEALVTRRQESEFVALCEWRARGTPIAYLLGSAGFYGRDFIVDESVLVPRPETEHLVDEAIAFLGELGERGSVLDVGTGCGAIACTIAAETSATVAATDVSSAAVALATKNADRLGVAGRCTFYEADLTEPVRAQTFDVVVANLPYVPSADIPGAPNPLAFEPRTALDGGPDGLAIYRRLLPQLPRLLKPNSLILLEAAPPTIKTLGKLTQSTLPDFTISVGYDYAGLARYIKGRK
jgi:release factor glutamine methyltransferase